MTIETELSSHNVCFLPTKNATLDKKTVVAMIESHDFEFSTKQVGESSVVHYQCRRCKLKGLATFRVR